MAQLHLVIGNKNYSSWSLRPWMALTMARIPFEETIIPLYEAQSRKKISEHSAAGKVPILHHGKMTIWESLAILEYLAEIFPDRKLWPVGKAARAAGHRATSPAASVWAFRWTATCRRKSTSSTSRACRS